MAFGMSVESGNVVVEFGHKGRADLLLSPDRSFAFVEALRACKIEAERTPREPRLPPGQPTFKIEVHDRKVHISFSCLTRRWFLPPPAAETVAALIEERVGRVLLGLNN